MARSIGAILFEEIHDNYNIQIMIWWTPSQTKVTMFSWEWWKGKKKWTYIVNLHLELNTSRVSVSQANTMNEQCLFND